MANVKLKDLYGDTKTYTGIDTVQLPIAGTSDETVDFFAASKLQSKSYTLTQNSDITIAPDADYVGLSQVDITVAVDGGGGGDIGIADVAMATISGSFSSDLVTQVAPYAFYSNSLITELSFPNCSSVGSGTFMGCASLSSLTLGSLGEDYIRAENVFYGCYTLLEAPVAQWYGSNTFAYCSALKSACLGAGSEGYAACIDNMFRNCTNLTDVYMTYSGSSSPLILKPGYEYDSGSYMFYGAASLSKAPEFVLTTLGWNAVGACIPSHMFEKCTSLQSITFYGGGNGSFGSWWFRYAALDCAFMSCDALRTVTIWAMPMNLSTSSSASRYFWLGSSVFAFCQNLRSLYIKFPSNALTSAALLSLSLSDNVFLSTPIQTGGGSIFVPASLLTRFRAAWSSVSARIVADNT